MRFALLVVLASCQGKAAPPSPGPGPAPVATPGSGAPPSDAASPHGDAGSTRQSVETSFATKVDGIQILAPGSEPRTLLRYHFVAPTTAPLVVEVDFDRTGPTGNGPVPTMVLGLRQDVLSVEADGTAQIRTTVVSVDAKDRPGATVQADAVRQQAELLTDATIQAAVTPEGATSTNRATLVARDVTTPLIGQATAQLKQFEQLAMPLPKEPLGVGGRWQYTRHASPLGSEVAMTTTVTITAIAGDLVTYQTATTITGPDHTIDDHGMKLDVKGVSGTGTGTGVLDLARPDSTGATSLTLGFEMTADGEHSKVSMTTATRIHAPAPAGAQGEHSAP